MKNTIPTEKDWRSEPWEDDLDIPYAYDHFAGKTIEDASDLFEENVLCYGEDLTVMPAACFGFYIRAYVNYLLSDDSRWDADAASYFFSIVEIRLEEIRSVGFLIDLVSSTLDHIKERQEWYDADESIYGSFKKRAEESQRLIS